MLELPSQNKGVEVILPRVTTLSRQRDRRLFIQVRFFPGYLFVRSDRDSYGYQEILRTSRIMGILGLKDSLTSVPPETIDPVKAIVDSERQFYPGST
jgi:transcription antitermination factor NusG